MIVDADALNLLGEHRSYIGRLPKGSILTPHPKELERLVGWEMSELVRTF